MVAAGATRATCAACGCTEEYEHPLSEYDVRLVLAVEFRWLCNDCWHEARYKQPPYAWVRNDGYIPPNSATYLQHEALELRERYPSWFYGSDEAWTLQLRPAWFGDRLAHPGYMAQRRRAVLTSIEAT